MLSAGDGPDVDARAKVGLIGTFDLANFGDLLLPAITERELIARLPDLVVRRYAPFGWEHPVSMDGGEVAEPLGPPTPQRRAEVAAACDAVVVGGGEIVHFLDHLLAPHYDVTTEAVIERAPSRWFVEGLGAGEATTTAWNAVGIPFDIDDRHAGLVRAAVEHHDYVAVRDERSRKRLEQLGIDREIDVVPDPGFLVPRLFDPELVERRRRLHATLGWLPPGRYVVVQGNGSMVNEVDRTSMAIEAALRGHPDVDVVVIETGQGHGDAEFAANFADRHPGRVWAPTAPLLPVDVVAIVAGAEAFVGVSLHAAITATAFGRRAVVFNAPRQSKHPGLVAHLDDRTGYVESVDELPAAIQRALAAVGPDAALPDIDRQVDHHFDRIADLISRASDRRGDAPPATPIRVRQLSSELAAVRTAHAVRGRRLLTERDALTELLDRRDARIADLEAELGSAAAEAERLSAALAGSQAEREVERASAARELDELRGALDRSEAALREIYATRTMRWLRWPRRAYGFLRR